MPEEIISIEVTLALYGQQSGPVYMSRETARHYAEQMVGRTLWDRAHGLETRYQRTADGIVAVPLRIIATRLEDDNPADPSKGRVVAICQSLQQRQMEVK
jgi:hypothetical protein